MHKETVAKMNSYKCKHCGRIVKRESDKAWLQSYCENTDKRVHIVKVKEKS